MSGKRITEKHADFWWFRAEVRREASCPLSYSQWSQAQALGSLQRLAQMHFQKRLRLQVAWCLMLGDGLDAARVAYWVGRHEVSFFNREYNRLFAAAGAGRGTTT